MDARLTLGARVLGAASRIAADRVDEMRGRALPRTPGQLARPATLDAVFDAGAPAGAPPLPRLRAARLPGVEFESSNCRNFLVDLEFERGGRQGRHRPRACTPRSPGPGSRRARSPT